MANAIKGGQHYAWDEKEEMIEAIKKRTQDQPIILVGHSFWGRHRDRNCSRIK
jgi:predicted aldo/keto reductase-like oxidoreductase